MPALALRATLPFDFTHSLRFIGQFYPAKGEQAVSQHSLTKAVLINNQAVAFRVTTTDAPDVLHLELFADTPISDETSAAVQDRAAFYLSLSDDLTPFYELAQKDEYFAPLVQELYGYHQVKFMTPFENACWAVLSNRNRLNIASVMKSRLTEALGKTITVDGENYPAFPEPHHLLEVDPMELIAIIRHSQKGEFLVHVARAFAGMDEIWLREAPYEDVEKWLLSIRGIGAWSSSFVMIRGLGRMDTLKMPETRLVEAASKLYGRRLSVNEVIELAQNYPGYQGYWAHYVRVGLG
jgi:DNA-3-methyladenine glycosylase II